MSTISRRTMLLGTAGGILTIGGLAAAARRLAAA